MVFRRGNKSFEEAFWARVTRSVDGCWVWTGGKVGRYGALIQDGRQVRAHRVSWEMANGSIPSGLFVCHRCDNPPCVNPSHLFLGTQHDNMRDAAAKGRLSTPRGRNQHTGRTHCKRGHAFDEDNTRMNNGRRQCRRCAHLQNQKYRLGPKPPEKVREWDSDAPDGCA